jgi:DNA-binding transcriptional MerR regulator
VSEAPATNTAPAAAPAAAPEWSSHPAATAIGLEQRASAVLEKMMASDKDTGDESSKEPSEVPAEDRPTKKDPVESEPDPESEPVAAAAPADDDVAKVRAARAARLAELREKERARVEASQARSQVDTSTARQRELEAELSAAREAARRAESVTAMLKDPTRFLELAREAGVDPASVGEYLRSAQEDPLSAATKRARAELTPELESIRKELAEAKEEAARELAALRAEREAERTAATQAQAEKDFMSVVTATDFPLTSALRAKHGEEQVLAMAKALVPTLPRDAEWSDLAGLIEDQLEAFASLRGEASPKPTPSTPSKKPEAAAKAKPLTNRDAAGRTEVDDDDDKFVSLDERAKRAMSRLA